MLERKKQRGKGKGWFALGRKKDREERGFIGKSEAEQRKEDDS